MRITLKFVAGLAIIAGLSVTAIAQETPDAAPDGAGPENVQPDAQVTSDEAMTAERLVDILSGLDPEARVFDSGVELTIADIPVVVIMDANADRMRAMIPIRSAAGLDPAELMRLMQANFDTALDARYAVANGRLWGTFIHPLSPLKREQLLSGLAQTVNLARTYGSFYSGGAGAFGGGDSGALYQDLLEDLLKKGEEI